MLRNATLSTSLLFTCTLFAASGGPDTYGYTWKDSNEPGGPVFNWIDITTLGTQLTGLADDNVIGPVSMQTPMQYYWYEVKKVWIGSNGYIAFNNVNIASPFPMIPLAGAPDDYIALMECDLTFAGAGNTGQLWYYDTADSTVFSYLNVPFWTNLLPNYTGSNTFQLILNKLDSTITVQFLQQTGFSFNSDVKIGIESLAGDIGLQHSANILPVVNYAVRYYAPAVPLISVTDGSVDWSGLPETQGTSLKRFGPQHPLTVNVKNTGNQVFSNFTLTATVLNSIGQVVATDQVTGSTLDPAFDTTITFANTFDPTQAGIYRFQGTLSAIPGELIASNNMKEREIVVYDTTAFPTNVTWAGPLDDGIGIGWDGGNAGVAAYVFPANYPAHVSSYILRIASNTNPAGCYLKLYDDNGPNGGPGTLLDSISVAPAQATVGSHLFPLAQPFTLTSGGLYVLWYMNGTFINIAQDIQPPFSRHTYEVLGNTWAEYRTREAADFHLGVQVTAIPIPDAGCTGFFGLINGINISSPTVIRTWVKNFSNYPISNFPVKYRYNSGPITTQTYVSPVLQPGDSALFTFGQQFTPPETATGHICAWTEMPGDVDATNDTACVLVNVFVGIDELGANPLSLAPNPARDEVRISGLPAGTWELAVFNVDGALVMQDRGATNAGGLVMPVTGLAPGTYNLQVLAGGRSYTQKFIVQR